MLPLKGGKGKKGGRGGKRKRRGRKGRTEGGGGIQKGVDVYGQMMPKPVRRQAPSTAFRGSLLRKGLWNARGHKRESSQRGVGGERGWYVNGRLCRASRARGRWRRTDEINRIVSEKNEDHVVVRAVRNGSEGLRLKRDRRGRGPGYRKIKAKSGGSSALVLPDTRFLRK